MGSHAGLHRWVTSTLRHKFGPTLRFLTAKVSWDSALHKTSFCGNAILSPEVFSGLAFKRITNYGKSASSPKYASSFHSAAIWWHRASVRNVVVLCHTILVSRYIYRNFFKKSIRLFARATALLCHWIWCSRGRWVEEMCFPVRWAGVSEWVSLHSGAMCNA